MQRADEENVVYGLMYGYVLQIICRSKEEAAVQIHLISAGAGKGCNCHVSLATHLRGIRVT